jgi:trigger factor
MAENETAETSSSADASTAVADGVEVAEPEFLYPVKIEEAGPAIKKVSVEIPADRIASKLAEQFKELRKEAAIPGFRVGHAPAKLIEKRFANDVKEQVRRNLISESYGQAVEKNNLQVLGEPQFDNAKEIVLPESGPLSYTFEVEVQPDMTLPSLEGIRVKKPKIEVKDENVDQAMSNLREQQGALVPIEDRGIQNKDYITADVHLKVDDKVVAHHHDAQIVVRPGSIAGIEVADLDQLLAGTKIGETKTITAKGPDGHPSESLRGKDVQIELAVKDIKRLELAEITPEFLNDLGFENEGELRQALREQMVERIDYDIAQAQREQVSKYLLENTFFELPARLSAKQVDRVMQRKSIDLLMRGVPQEQVEKHLEPLRVGVRDEALRELKLFFILQKIAAQQGADVEEAELNGRIAMLAAQRGVRPEKLKHEMSTDGSLSSLYIQMREQKSLDKILESAQIEEIDVTAPAPPAAPTTETPSQP